MIISISTFKYSIRTKASYLAKEALKEINRRYYWKYAPSDFFAADGSIALMDSSEETEFVNGVEIPKRVQRTLDDGEKNKMIIRMSSDPDYKAEIVDFHLSPVGDAPLLSQLLETYEPNAEEQGAILKAESFFYTSGTESNPKKEESSKSIAEQLRPLTEATTQENT